MIDVVPSTFFLGAQKIKENPFEIGNKKALLTPFAGHPPGDRDLDCPSDQARQQFGPLSYTT